MLGPVLASLNSHEHLKWNTNSRHPTYPRTSNSRAIRSRAAPAFLSAVMSSCSYNRSVERSHHLNLLDLRQSLDLAMQKQVPGITTELIVPNKTPTSDIVCLVTGSLGAGITWSGVAMDDWSIE